MMWPPSIMQVTLALLPAERCQICGKTNTVPRPRMRLDQICVAERSNSGMIRHQQASSIEGLPEHATKTRAQTRTSGAT